MQLSRLQRRVLESYQEFHGEPPTIGKLISRSLVAHIAMLMGIGALLAIALAADLKYVAAGIAGAVIGVLSRDLCIFMRSVRIWPVLESVIDWEKVDELLDDESR